MKKKFQFSLGLVACCLGLCPGSTVLLASPAVPASASTPEPVLDTMAAELERSMSVLGQEDVPPYFMSYELTELHTISLSGSFGGLMGMANRRTRQLDLDLRVGGFELDNTHPRRGDGSGRRSDRYSYIEAPVDSDPAVLRRVLWEATDKKYKRAVENLTAVRTNVQVKVEETDSSPDFSATKSVDEVEDALVLDLDEALWTEKVARYTAPFSDYESIYQADANLTAQSQVRWYVSSDGSRLRTSRAAYRLVISAVTKASDGMELPRHETFFASSADGLPSDQTVLATVKDIILDLEALRSAPIVDPYTGPAILSGRAAGVFFHEVFGHRVEGHRQKNEQEGQTFKSKVGERILPETFSISFDPTRSKWGETDLSGFYRYDNEGVLAQPVRVVSNGVFERFLMSRSPIDGEPVSNGHGRKQPGYQPVSRQSNLIVEVSDPVSRDELKKLLIDRLVAEDKPFGLYFEDIQGGFTLTGRRVPNAFNVLPILVHRVYPDGREELVRGVDLIGTPLTAFSEVVRADDRVEIFNGMCGAESGSVPVSAASPGLLIGRVEVQKKEKSQERPPLLPAPPPASDDPVMGES